MDKYQLRIDSGFVNHRKALSILGEGGRGIINDLIAKLPEMPEWQKNIQIDRLYTMVVQDFCRIQGIKSFEQIIADGNGHLAAGLVKIRPAPAVYERNTERVKLSRETQENEEYSIIFDIDSNKITSSTLRSKIADGDEIIIVAEFRKIDDKILTFEPLVMGLSMITEPAVSLFNPLWLNTSIYHITIEDIDEFEKTKIVPIDADFSIMSRISEKAIKNCFAEIFSSSAPKDWGGEQSDFFTNNIHIKGKRLSAAFLLKGPAKFFPMKLTHLGKNNDQIVRLSKEPAELLVLQHCHEITPPVIDTLRAFSLTFSNVRPYCAIDGRDTLRILKAYNLLDKALDDSQSNHNDA